MILELLAKASVAFAWCVAIAAAIGAAFWFVSYVGYCLCVPTIENGDDR